MIKRERWNIGTMEKWKDGKKRNRDIERMEKWKTGILEEWKDRNQEYWNEWKEGNQE